MKILRVILAIVAGVVIGGVVNMALVMLGSAIVPAPEGVDPASMESVAASAHLYQPKHFLFPFLAHAIGTLAGATAAHLIAARYRDTVAWIIAGLFFAGGVAAATMIPAPVWFIASDLVLAYFPMALIATKIGNGLRPTQ